MTKQEFIETVDGAPFELEKVAELAIQCSNFEIADAGEAFMRAQNALLGLLDELEIELG